MSDTYQKILAEKYQTIALHKSLTAKTKEVVESASDCKEPVNKFKEWKLKQSSKHVVNEENGATPEVPEQNVSGDNNLTTPEAIAEYVKKYIDSGTVDRIVIEDYYSNDPLTIVEVYKDRNNTLHFSVQKQ